MVATCVHIGVNPREMQKPNDVPPRTKKNNVAVKVGTATTMQANKWEAKVEFQSLYSYLHKWIKVHAPTACV